MPEKDKDPLYRSYSADSCFVNEEGVKWWFESDLTDHAASKGFTGIRAFLTEQPSGEHEFVLVEQILDKTGFRQDIIITAPDRDDFVCQIDRLSVERGYRTAGKKRSAKR